MPVAAQATHRVHMEVMPLFAGYLPLPDVRLFKYLPHHSAHSSQLDAGKDTAGDCPAQAGGTLCLLSLTGQQSCPATPPRMWPGASLRLGVGRVFSPIPDYDRAHAAGMHSTGHVGIGKRSP